MKKILLILVVFLGFAGCTSANEGSTSLLAAPVALSDQFSFETYQVEVICDLPTAIAAGKFDWVDPDFTPASFPEANCMPGQTEVTLVAMGGNTDTSDVLAELDRRGLRPSTLPELLALGASQPGLQRKNPIVALGSLWRHPRGRLNCPVLRERVHGPSLDLRGVHDGWLGRCRFLASRK